MDGRRRRRPIMLAIGVWPQRRHGGQAWGRWFSIFGHIALLGNLAALAFKGGLRQGLLFIAVDTGCIVASVWRQNRRGSSVSPPAPRRNRAILSATKDHRSPERLLGEGTMLPPSA